jgi:hypothetical protein
MNDENIKIEEIKSQAIPVIPIYSNICALSSREGEVALIDFGLVAPSYSEPYENEDYHLTRIALSWDMVDYLHKCTGDMLKDRRKKKKTSGKSK